MSKRNDALGMEHCTVVDLYHIVTLSIFKDRRTIIQVNAIASLYTVYMEHIDSRFSRVILCTRKLSRGARFALAWLQPQRDKWPLSSIVTILQISKVLY